MLLRSTNPTAQAQMKFYGYHISDSIFQALLLFLRFWISLDSFLFQDPLFLLLTLFDSSPRLQLLALETEVVPLAGILLNQNIEVVFVLVGISQLVCQWVQNVEGVSSLPRLFLLPALTSALLWPVVLVTLRGLRRYFQVA